MDTPIKDFLESYASKESTRLHMPGHKGNPKNDIENFDITEIDGADCLYNDSGIIKKSRENVIFEPAGASGEVKSIEMHHEVFEMAEPGDNIGFNVRGVGKNDIRRGDVAGHTTDAPTVAKEFTAQVVVLQHPGVITVGYTPVFHCHTSQTACTFLELTSKLDPATGQPEADKPDFIKTGDAAIVQIKPTKPMVMEEAKNIPPMGRFAIRDMGQTVAAGLCLKVTPAK